MGGASGDDGGERGSTLPPRMRSGVPQSGEPRAFFAPLVLVASLRIDHTDALAQTLAAAGYEVVIHSRASAAERAAAYVMPDVVLVDEEMFDASGDAFVASLRSGASQLASVPVIALVDGSEEAAAARYAAGADLCVPKTARVADVVAQLGALIRLSLRCRVGASQPARSRATQTTLTSGSLSQVSLTSLLTLLEMEVRSGVLEVHATEGTARLVIVRGRFVRALLDDEEVDPLTAAGVLITWDEGEFTFDAMSVDARTTGAPAIGETIDAAIALTNLGPVEPKP
jgi:DNA-binding response OmpR family regulator